MRIVRHRGKWAARGELAGKIGRWSLGNLDATKENYPAAERALEKLVAEKKRPAVQTCGAILDAYLEDSKERRIAWDRLHYAAKALKPFWGEKTPEQVTRENCRIYTDKRRKAGRGDGTIKKEFRTLSAALRWNDKRHPGVIEAPTAPPPRDRWITKEEFTRLADAALSTPHLCNFLHLAIATGARKEAIFQLRWEMVDFEKGTIFLGFKAGGKKRATVPMNRTIRAVLANAHDGALTDYVVEYGGGPVSSVRTAWARACKEAKLDDFHPHDLRHTAAVWMISDGVPLSMVSQYLGHTSTEITERIYARYIPQRMQPAADALDLGQCTVVPTYREPVIKTGTRLKKRTLT